MQYADAAIAGAGIIGLSVALELTSAGLRVVVFERGQAMRECSWAAAGMLAATDPDNPSPLRMLSELSFSLYPEFLTKVERLSKKNIPIRTTQALQGTHILPPGVQPLSDQAIHAIAPELQASGLTFFSLDEQSLDPRDLARALPDAARAAGITLVEQTAVISTSAQRSAVDINTIHGEWSAANFINACGAWASDLTAVPISPRKGQILLVESHEPQLTAVIRTPELYLVPRGNGQIIIGATVENAGFDKQVDPAAIAVLHNAAAALWPPIRNARIVDTWAGLRPAATDSLPVIGPSIGIDVENTPCENGQTSRSWLAVGHFRNGVLLAPGTARLLRQMILKEPLSIDAGAFHAGRFTPSLAR
jgi:glycine oxidase